MQANTQKPSVPVLRTLFREGEWMPDTGEWIVDRDGGVFRHRPGSGEDSDIEIASPVPVVLTSLVTDAESGLRQVELAYYCRGIWEFIICPRSEIADKARIIRLADQGLFVDSQNAKALVKYLGALLAHNRNDIPRREEISRLGWFRGRFIPYDDEIRLTLALRRRKLMDSAGSPEAWRTEAVRRMHGNVPLRLYLAGSFASVLAEPLGRQNFVVHLWGATGTGKSVALMLAASVWGRPDGDLFGTMNATLNYMQAQAALLRNLPLCLDELQTIRTPGGSYDRLIMQLGVGVGRGRAGREGQVRETKTWHSVALTTGEEPIVQPNSGGGAVNRVLQIQVKDDVPLIPDAGETVQVLRRHYGQAGYAFVMSMLHDGVLQKDMLREIAATCEDYETRLRGAGKAAGRPLTGKQTALLALLLTADSMAELTVYHSGETLRPEDVLPYAETEDGVSRALRAQEYIMNRIAVHTNDFQGIAKDPHTGQIVEEWGHQPTGRIYGKLTDQAAIVNKSVLIEWLDEGGFSFDAVKHAWANSGFLVRNAAGRFSCAPPYGLTGSYVKLMIETD